MKIVERIDELMALAKKWRDKSIVINEDGSISCSLPPEAFDALNSCAEELEAALTELNKP